MTLVRASWERDLCCLAELLARVPPLPFRREEGRGAFLFFRFRFPFLFNDPFLRQFFGPGFGDQGRPQTRRAESLGSGVIISEDGYILTANHVIEGAEGIKVSFAEGSKESTAKIVGADPPTDVAVLKIE